MFLDPFGSRAEGLELSKLPQFYETLLHEAKSHSNREMLLHEKLKEADGEIKSHSNREMLLHEKLKEADGKL
jgi:hypothetical protein